VAATRMDGGSIWTQLYSRQTSSELRRSHRVSWAVFQWILGDIKELIEPKLRSGPDAVSAEEQLGMFLHRLASGMTYPTLAAMYSKSISTVHSCLDKVRKAIILRLGRVIKRPTPDEAAGIAAMFTSYTKGVLFGAIGAMDGTHIHVRVPSKELASSYYHHKYGLSIVLHCVCDSRCDRAVLFLRQVFRLMWDATMSSA
jgi:hypothetical protein